MEDVKTYLHKNWEECKAILDEYSEHEEVQILLELVRNTFNNNPRSIQLPYPLIVLEGLDGSGKTTISQLLAGNINAVYIHPPMEIVENLKDFFKNYNAQLKRAYYTVCNYVTAYQMQQECKKHPVVLDRYWNSSAAYGLMEYCTKNNKKLPEIDDSVYFWPMDLQKPNFVIFLTLSEEERKRRIMLRNKEPTKDEIRISNSSDICEMIKENYRKMRYPSVVEVDSSGEPLDVLHRILKII